MGKDNPFLVRAAVAYLSCVMRDRGKAKDLLSAFLQNSALSQYEREMLLREQEKLEKTPDEKRRVVGFFRQPKKK